LRFLQRFASKPTLTKTLTTANKSNTYKGLRRGVSIDIDQ